MMKKIIKTVSITSVIALSSVFAAGCSMFGSTSVRQEETQNAVDRALARGAENSQGEGADAATEKEETQTSQRPDESDKGIDLDLTKLSSNMVYAEVYNMMNDPEKYMGKSIKIHGAFVVYEEAFNGENVYACLVKDAAACCATGIEFVRKGDYKYPGDYPDRGDEIVVVGTLDVYEDKGNKYFTLKNAEMQVV